MNLRKLVLDMLIKPPADSDAHVVEHIGEVEAAHRSRLVKAGAVAAKADTTADAVMRSIRLRALDAQIDSQGRGKHA